MVNRHTKREKRGLLKMDQNKKEGWSNMEDERRIKISIWTEFYRQYRDHPPPIDPARLPRYGSQPCPRCQRRPGDPACVCYSMILIDDDFDKDGNPENFQSAHPQETCRECQNLIHACICYDDMPALE